MGLPPVGLSSSSSTSSAQQQDVALLPTATRTSSNTSLKPNPVGAQDRGQSNINNVCDTPDRPEWPSAISNTLKGPSVILASRSTLARHWQPHLRSRSFNGRLTEVAPPAPMVWPSPLDRPSPVISSGPEQRENAGGSQSSSPCAGECNGDDENGLKHQPAMSKATLAKMARLRRERQQKVRNAASVPNLVAHQRVLAGIKKSLKQVQQKESWTLQVEAMQQLGRAAGALDQHLLALVVRSLLQEVRNLRSSVSRCAIATICQLFEQQSMNAMEPHLDPICQCLLHKSGENVLFFRQDVDRALEMILEHTAPARLAVCLIDHGASHRNASVRRTCSHFAYRCLERMGAKSALENRQFMEKAVPSYAHWLMDTAPLTRYYGRSAFALLGTEQSLDKLAQRYLSPPTWRNVQSILRVIQDKGAGDRPQDEHSALLTARNSAAIFKQQNSILPSRTQPRR
ncbi:uncharacterized protein LOC111259990 isoform X1 [Varroa jacobsoni]|uniref:TOG domain-containing protein n=1 Tax=Varroa destructor TaxID=109461 RepID=A0A7M7KGT6_VARDE|nr:uncharacterized protein LOC111251244 isoform X4 [Varroa destructor]XP_022688143.1 uncharacterized protein LOC111259990 isoform X1 [Varroa jacobsoni]XP_022688144.1 uncharacterized protein LOC111259990 isoform X1 [Varroa jacobsoni]XP_022688145.1 uncharacterized protein LOC111259990 isoform X1 [Varroa jacobsoni]XP_022688146.1 uncharacterized protein LOC111259990 isoform X1 [Varroa jacobsoni]